MSEALVALSGAAIGSVTGLLGAFITARQQQRLEALKFTAERRAEAETQRRLAIADLARTLSRVIQLMSWFTWEAEHRPLRISSEWVDRYDSEMKPLLPELMSAVSIVAALSEPTYRVFDPLVTKAFKLDGQIGTAASTLGDDPDGTRTKIAEMLGPVNSLFDEFRETLARVMGGEAALP